MFELVPPRRFGGPKRGKRTTKRCSRRKLIKNHSELDPTRGDSELSSSSGEFWSRKVRLKWDLGSAEKVQWSHVLHPDGFHLTYKVN